MTQTISMTVSTQPHTETHTLEWSVTQTCARAARDREPGKQKLPRSMAAFQNGVPVRNPRSIFFAHHRAPFFRPAPRLTPPTFAASSTEICRLPHHPRRLHPFHEQHGPHLHQTYFGRFHLRACSPRPRHAHRFLTEHFCVPFALLSRAQRKQLELDLEAKKKAHH